MVREWSRVSGTTAAESLHRWRDVATGVCKLYLPDLWRHWSPVHSGRSIPRSFQRSWRVDASFFPLLPVMALFPQLAMIGSGTDCDRRFWPFLIVYAAIALAPWVISGGMERGQIRKYPLERGMCMSFWTAAWLQFPALGLLLGQQGSCHGDGQGVLVMIVSVPTTSVLTVIIAVIHDWFRLRDVRMNMQRG